MSNDLKTEKNEKSKPSTKKEVVKMLVVVGIIFGATFGGYFIMQVALNTNMPLVVVVSPSMEPTIMTGDLLFVKGPVYADIIAGDHLERTGDVIIYDSNGVWPDPEPDPIVHRCVGKRWDDEDQKYYFIAHGDNINTNPYPDPPETPGYIEIPQEKVLGVVVGRIPWIGYIKIWLTNSGLAIPIMVMLGLLLVISIVYDITHPEEESEKEKNKKKRHEDADSSKSDVMKIGENQGPSEFKDHNLDMGV